MLNLNWFAGIALASAVAFVPEVAAAASPTEFVALDPNQGQLPESITTDDDGNLYVSIGTSIGVISPEGELSTFATLPVPAGTFTSGLKFGPDGYLYAGTAGFTPDPAVAFIWRISPDGDDVELFSTLDPNGFPNDLAFDDCGNLYVTDPFLGLIWKIDENGDPDVWLADPLLEANFGAPYLLVAPFGVDGIAIDKHGDVYVGNLDYGRIVKIEVEKDGDAGDVEVFYENIGLIGGVDGIAFDKNGTLFLAVHGQDRIVALDQKGKKVVATVVAEGDGLQQPSSLVFGATKQSKKTLYIANFSILAALGVKPGPPTPGVLTLKVKHQGLPLP
jgi:sugar lactone lactonase YvrE